MTKNWLLYLSLLMCGLAGYTAYPVHAAQSESTSIAADEIGSRLPDFSLHDLKGHTVSSADLRGKVVLIDFWGTWCQPCKKEMPGYQKLLDRYGPEGFAVVGFKVSMMKDTENPLAFAKRIGVLYPLVVATDELTEKFGGIEGLPTTLIYDREGILRKKIIGFEYTSAIEAAIKPMLEQHSMFKGK
ncbi:MAG TPA: redoxin domain-containing protein [Candidatus Angelobacter sp.]|nr:redoxin domain-containing protein [Candidatus Angelobacter sp.]